MNNHKFIKNKKFIILNQDKSPMQGNLKDYKSYDEVKDRENLGILVEEPYVVLDVDDADTAKIMLKMVKDLDIKTNVCKTTRGYHFWFESKKVYANNVDIPIPLSLKVDVRSHGKIGYLMIKQKGVWREWINLVDEIETLPFYFEPLASNNKYSFLGAQDGDGRNSQLYSYILTLTSEGYNPEQIKEIYNLINRFVLRDKISKKEMDTILRDESFVNIIPDFYDKNTFLHHKMADFLMGETPIYRKNNLLYLYEDGSYTHDDNNIRRLMIKYVPGLRKDPQGEVLFNLSLKVDEPDDMPDHLIVTQNGIIDSKKMELMPFSDKYFIPNKIDAFYDPEAYDENVDKVLDKITSDRGKKRPEIRKLLLEMIGYLLVPTARYQKAFILYGSGANGKSTLVEMIEKLLGTNNVSYLSLTDLSDKFKLSSITNKMANLGDDISNEPIKDSGTFKKLVTGDMMEVEKKFQDPYPLYNYAKLVFATNDLPELNDTTPGMIRRLTVIPFDARFTSDDPDYDPFIIDKLTTPKALSYLLNLALEGLNRLYKNKGFSEPQDVTDVIDGYEEEHNNLIPFLRIENDFDGRTTHELFGEYKMWCIDNLFYYEKSITKFNREVRILRNDMDTKQERIEGKVTQVWRAK